jgi:hypothetical protein
MDQLKPNAEPIVKKNVNFAPKAKSEAPIQKVAKSVTNDVVA